MFETYTGANNFERQRTLRARIDAFVADNGELAYEALDGDEASFERIQESIMSLPFLATQKLVVLLSPGSQKQFQEYLMSGEADIPEVTTVIIVEPALDKRGKYFKWLKTNTTFTDFAPLNELLVAKWASNYAKEQGSQLSLGDANYLIQRVGTDQPRVANEIEKLSLHVDSISRSDIEALVEPTPQSKIFDLLEAAFKGNPETAMKLYKDQRAQKVEPQEIIAMLGWQLRQIALAKAAGTKHDVVREAKLSSYGATKAKMIADTIPLESLKQMLSSLVELDVKAKRQSINLDLALQGYVLRLSTRP